jgi:hypothetical protein
MKWLMICIMLTGCSNAQLYTASTSLIIADYSQTINIVESGHKENNPILGKYPSKDRVRVLIGAGILTHSLLAVYLPEREKRIYLWGMIIAETAAVIHNRRMGIDFSF